jgi:hypothetical protein
MKKKLAVAVMSLLVGVVVGLLHGCTGPREYVVPIQVYVDKSEDAEVNVYLMVYAAPVETTTATPNTELQVPVSLVPKGTKNITKNKTSTAPKE